MDLRKMDNFLFVNEIKNFIKKMKICDNNAKRESV